MANKKQSNDLKTSLEQISHINWLDGIHKLPNNVDKELLDQCSNLIQKFINSDESLPKTTIKSKSKSKSQKQQVSKIKKSKIKVTKIKQSKLNPISQKIKTKTKILKKTTQPFHSNNISPTTGYPCYPSAFPCFRSCGPINCPENKLPMPRDLWYRIVYSQVLEQQLGSGEASIRQSRSNSHLQSSSKRKHKEDESITDKSSYNNLHKNKSNSNNSRRQQTMNAALSSTSIKVIKLDASLILDDHVHKSEFNQDTSPFVPSNSYKPFPMDKLEYVAETLPLQIENKHSYSNLMYRKTESKENLETILWNTNVNKTVSLTQSAHAELINHPKIHRGISADATLERKNDFDIIFKKEKNLLKELIPIASAPSASIVLNNQSNFEEMTTSPIQFEQSKVSIEQSTNKIIKDNSHINSSMIFEHPLTNQLYEYYNLEDIPRLQLFQQLNRRLTHIRQTLKTMSSNDIEIKLKYRRDVLIKKRQTPIQSLTKDERIAMAEPLDESSSKYFPVNNNDQLENEQLSPIPPALLSYDTILPVEKNAIISETSMSPSMSTFNTVRPSAISQSTVLLSTTTQFSEKPEKVISWNHPLLSNLMNMFEPMIPLCKAQIHKQLARRYEHICKKAKELSKTQLQAQINSKFKALEQSKKILQPNKDECLRIAELELCLFELEKEQIQRDQID
ncbi:unnamed protein product [Rotaria sordida]|uniref:Uncharacterized protein n=1 Tax=Rotaria sordida TaxID=392033 RepID=A0A815D688_9BILA|nr:unnamed protein product [Rotaria sordida]